MFVFQREDWCCCRDSWSSCRSEIEFIPFYLYFSALGDLFVDYFCETGTGVLVKTGTGIVVGARTGDWIRGKIVLVISFDVTGIMKIV
jgi:hypothetical protein